MSDNVWCRLISLVFAGLHEGILHAESADHTSLGHAGAITSDAVAAAAAERQFTRKAFRRLRSVRFSKNLE